MIILERKAYHSQNTSPEEQRAIQMRMYFESPQIMVWNEMPMTTLFQLELFKARYAEVTVGKDRFSMVVNIVRTQFPGSEYRSSLIHFLLKETQQVNCFFMATGNSRLKNASTSLIAKIAGVNHVEIYSTYQKALEKARAFEAQRLAKRPKS
ncbi:hypothetical protein [Pontibacter sp. G13]|uniref:hypothetical protein n=1 Tax=Pontibacter sp. G13 TaxID=3074898 RepID=UPI00288BB823|nr:hypothetical protein [Pontibacter sp. G13]WNJ17259.1 hypothetical protein RJD25_20580 [Pontibacter sp. G13]